MPAPRGRRPAVLLHADLHERNVLINRGLWLLDWELTLVGDPLYDAASALNRTMWQDGAHDIAYRCWTESMDWLGARTQNEADLRRYLEYEHYKSVLVDVVRYTQSVTDGRTPADDAARALSRKIVRVAALLDRPAPKQRELASMLAKWAGRD